MMKQWTIIIFILFWLGWHLAFPTNLISSDLGRFISNGQLIFQGHWDVIYKNYYSYTNPAYPFTNYHWFFGVLCYALWHCAGFTGISILYIAVELFTFYLFFRCWQRYSSFWMLCAFALLSIPLISMRSSIRPEGVSYLLCGLFWYLIDLYQQKKLRSQYLITGLCVLQVIWVNSHIFFMMGPVLTAVFWWQARCSGEKEQVKVLQKLFFFLLGMCLINPFGVNIFAVIFDTWNKASLFSVFETRPIFYFLDFKDIFANPICLYFVIAPVLLITPLLFLIQREGIKKHVFIVLLVLLLSAAALKAVRMIGLFGYCWIPLSSYAYSRWMQEETAQLRKNIEIVLVVMGILVSAFVTPNWKEKHGLGVPFGTHAAAEFFKREKISGPIFNNYNIGGYLMFHLSPEYKLFVDDRGMAAYPEDFFKSTYLSIEFSEDDWRKMDQKYHFNVIFYSPEVSYWRDRFIWHRFGDPAWALVFFREDVAIFLKRNERNVPLINRFEIPVRIKSPTQIDIISR